MRRVLRLLLVPAALLILLFSFLEIWALPRLANWAQEKIIALSEDPSSPVVVSIDKIEFKRLGFKTILYGVKFNPKAESLKDIIPQVLIKNIVLRIDAFDLILGRWQIAHLELNRLATEINMDPLLKQKGDPEKLPLQSLFEIIEKIPLQSLTFQDLQIIAKSKTYDVAAITETNLLRLENHSEKLKLLSALPFRLQHKDLKTDLKLNGQITLSPQLLNIQTLNLTTGDLVIKTKGLIQQPENFLIAPVAALQAETNFSIQTLIDALKPFLKLKKEIQTTGQLFARTEIKLNKSFDFESTVQIKTSNIQLKPFKLGDLNLNGKLTSKMFSVEKLLLDHPAGLIRVDEAKIQLNSPFTFSATLQTAKIDLQEMFKSLGLHDIPVYTQISARFPCQGQVSPFTVSCKGEAASPEFVVKSSQQKNASSIVELRKLSTQGEVSLDMEQVKFETLLQVGESKGKVAGRVHFNDGFKINYETQPSLRFADVHHLANLKFEGTTTARGSVQGDSHAATFDILFNADNFIFEKYKLGNVQGRLDYQKGVMSLKELSQSIGQSLVEGELDVDLVKETLEGKFKSERIDAYDLFEVISNFWKNPLEVKALGRAEATVSGPLNFWKMNSNIKAEFRNGRISGDSFDQVQIHILGTDGDLNIKKAELIKNQSRLTVEGGINSEKEIGLTVHANNFKLEESEFVGRIQNNTSGQFNASAQILGTIDEPDLRANGTLADVLIEEQEVPSSFFKIHLTSSFVDLETNLFGNKIQLETQVPFQKHKLPFRLRLKTNNWSFTNVLGSLGALSLQNQYESQLTSDIELNADNGDVKQSSGQILIKNFRVQRGSSYLKNKDLISVQVENGFLTLKNTLIEGPQDSFIKLEGENFSLDQLKLNIQANADLRLLHFLLPFLDDLGGRLRLESSVAGSLWQPEVLGNSKLSDGFIKLKGFPHPIEKLNADFIFSQKRLLVQSLSAQMAQGQINGEGVIQIIGPQELPIQIRLRANGLKLNVPDRVRSQGDAQLLISGRWFPYILSGKYLVQSAFVDKEFTDSNENSIQIKGNQYLPKVLRKSQFDPVLLDLQVDLGKNSQVKNSLIEGTVTGLLNIKGPPQNPVLLGQINTAPGSKIIVKDKYFDVITGTVNFNNPEEINPDLYISAQSRITNYDISILAQGPVKSLQIRMSSAPPLSDSDIVSLLALGVTSSQLDSKVSSTEQEKQLGYEALGLGLSRTKANKLIEQTFGLNVQISSSYDQTKNISIPKVTVSRKVSEKLNASYARPINTDSSQEFKLQYLINNNVSAIGSYEERGSQSNSLTETERNKTNIFGLDLEFKREFK